MTAAKSVEVCSDGVMMENRTAEVGQKDVRQVARQLLYEVKSN